jgi:c-di-GMP-binding flagellar brake protein YcgR
MERPEEISGKKMLELIEQLKKDKIVLSVHILDTENEGLSIILGTKIVNDKQCLILDFPTGIGGMIFHAKDLKVAIEFADKNKIHYNLKSVIEDVTRQNLYVRLPRVIYRIQRRKFFRTESPLGLKMIIDEKSERYEFNVINISEGGALISHPAKLHNDIRFFKGAVKPVIIVCREDDHVQTIKIDKAEISRIKSVRETGNYNYALQFIECDKREEKDLRNLIYLCQRRCAKVS